MRKIFLLLLPLALLVSGCGSRGPVQSRDFILNTYVSVTIYHGGGEEDVQAALDLCRDYEKVFSRTDPESELYRINHREVSTVSQAMGDVLREGLRMSELSHGAFDITAGSLTELWDFTAEAPVTPDPAAIEAALPHVGWEKVRLRGEQILFSDPGTILDLGGIAKGYIADRMADLLRERGVDSAIIDLGGNLYCLGKKPGGEPFHIGIQHPEKARDQVVGGIDVADRSVVTSGIYERSFTENGKLYHHILDTKTGWPKENELLSATVVTETSVLGDALSTAVFVLGLEEGMALVESLPEAEAVFITRDMEIHVSKGLEGSFVPVD